MADILKIARDFNPKKALTHIFDKIDEIIKKVNTLWSNAPTVTPKVYKALLTQTGTDAPVATVLVNTLSGTPVWSYDSVGTYRLTLAGEFVSGKTAVNINAFIDAADGNRIGALRANNNQILVSTGDNTLTTMNDILLESTITIEVYP